MVEWILQNKEWLFSGVGLTVLLVIWRLLAYLHHKKEVHPIPAAILPAPVPIIKGPELKKELNEKIIASERERVFLDPENISQILKDTPPLQLEDVKKHYSGIRVKYTGKLTDVAKGRDKGDLVDVSISFLNAFGWLITTVPLLQYPELGLLKTGHEITIEGKISEIHGWHRFELVECKLFFDFPGTT